MKLLLSLILVSTTALAGVYDGTYKLSTKFCKMKTKKISGDARDVNSVKCATSSLFPYYDIKVPSHLTKLWIVHTNFCATQTEQLMKISKSNSKGWISEITMGAEGGNETMKFDVSFKDQFAHLDNLKTLTSKNSISFSGTTSYKDEFVTEDTKNSIIISKTSAKSLDVKIKRIVAESFSEGESREFEETMYCRFPKL